MKRVAIAAIILSVVISAGVSAYGGGGGFSAKSMPIPGWTNNELSLSYRGGFGYGVTERGQRIGGFGVGVSTEDDRVVGGFGGVINGQQVRLGPFTASLNTWVGIGGLSMPTGIPREFFGYFAEVNGEVGLAVLPWLQVSGYLGMQAMGNLIPGAPIRANSIYTPVTGVRVSWGSF